MFDWDVNAPLHSENYSLLIEDLHILFLPIKITISKYQNIIFVDNLFVVL